MVIKRNQETVAVDFRLSRSLAQVLSSLVGKIKKKRKKSSNQKRLNSRRFGVSLYQLDPSYRALLPFLGFFPPISAALPSVSPRLSSLPFPPSPRFPLVFRSHGKRDLHPPIKRRFCSSFVDSCSRNIILFFHFTGQICIDSYRDERFLFFFFFLVFLSLSRNFKFIHSFVRSIIQVLDL